MAEIRRSDSMGNIEQKSTKHYESETVRDCPTCGKSKLWIKLRLDNSTTLECPNCDQTVTVPKGVENLP